MRKPDTWLTIELVRDLVDVTNEFYQCLPFKPYRGATNPKCRIFTPEERRARWGDDDEDEA